MPTVWHAGAPWYDGALAAARRQGVLDEVSAIVADHRSGASVVTYPDPAGNDRIRVQRGELAAVVSDLGVVLGFVTRSTGAEAPTPARPSPRRTKGRSSTGKIHTRGPRTYDELKEWLVEDGFTLEQTGKGHIAVVRSDGWRIKVIPSTASDHRSLANDVSDLRRAGYEARRPM